MGSSSETSTDWRAFATLVVVATIGAGLAVFARVPAPFLTGPAALVSLLAVVGLKVAMPVRLRDLCFIVVGLGMGTGLTPEALAAATRWPVPLAILAVALVVLVTGGSLMLRKVFGFGRDSSILAATPGHLSFVLAMSEELDQDTARVAVVQALRVLYLTLLVPIAVKLWTGADLAVLPAARELMPLAVIFVLLALAAAVGVVALRYRLPAALLLSGLSVSGLAHATGLVSGAMPSWISTPAFVLIGGLIGTRFVGVSLRQIGTAAVASLALTVLALVVTVAAAEVAHALVGMPSLDLVIAFAPGGIETMAALSLILGADPAFVAFHHLSRLVFLSFLVPALLVRRGGRGD